MTTPLDEDNNLTIQLLSYDKPTGLTERFYFLEMSTLQATTLFPPDKKIATAKISAYTNDNKHLEVNTAESFKTIRDFNDFFLNNQDYYIHNCDLKLENEIRIESHDDGEVSIQILRDNLDQIIIDHIFKKYGLDTKLIETLKNKPGHYIAIDRQNNITGDFNDFDDYLANGRG